MHFRWVRCTIFGHFGAGVSCAKTYGRGTAISTTTFDIHAACEVRRLVRGIGGVAEQTCESGTLRKLACLWNVSWMF